MLESGRVSGSPFKGLPPRVTEMGYLEEASVYVPLVNLMSTSFPSSSLLWSYIKVVNGKVTCSPNRGVSYGDRPGSSHNIYTSLR